MQKFETFNSYSHPPSPPPKFASPLFYSLLPFCVIIQYIIHSSLTLSHLFLQPNQIGMTWQYTIEWHDTSSHGINSHRKSIVVVTSKPRSQSEKQLIQIKTWTSSSTASSSFSSHNDDNDKIMAGKSNTDTTNNDNNNNPAEIVLFAQVMRGDSPVIGAKVMASVSFESTNNASVVTLSPVRLHDNGYGGENEDFLIQSYYSPCLLWFFFERGKIRHKSGSFEST